MCPNTTGYCICVGIMTRRAETTASATTDSLTSATTDSLTASASTDYFCLVGTGKQPQRGAWGDPGPPAALPL